MGWGSDKMFGKRKRIDQNKLREIMAPTQNLVTEQLGLSRQLMDPQSAVNMQMRNLMAQRSAESGAQVGLQMSKIGAMRNVSPAQAMMQARMGQNQAMGGVNQRWLEQVQSRFGQGLGLMGDMTGQQQGLNQNTANAYIQSINAANQARQSRMGMTMGLVGSAMSFGSGFIGGHKEG